MTNENKLDKKNCLSNSLFVENKIKLKIYKGVITGNIITEPSTECEPNSLSFNCEENSQYIQIL